MEPIPCIHCGYNFMRRTLDPHAPRLCNGCEVRENLRNPKAKKMETVAILIQCPKTTQAEIEEYCLSHGLDFSKYFLSLHDTFLKSLDEETKEIIENEQVDIADKIENDEKIHKPKGKVKKK